MFTLFALCAPPADVKNCACIAGIAMDTTIALALLTISGLVLTGKVASVFSFNSYYALAGIGAFCALPAAGATIYGFIKLFEKCKMELSES